MHHIFRSASFFVLTLMLAGCTGPQKTAGVKDAPAPIGSTRILVQVEESPEDAFKSAARLLQREGYTIATSDSDLGTLRTETKPLKGSWEARYSVSIVNEDPTQLQITGHASVPQLGESAIQKKGQSGSLMREGWKEMHLLAEAISEASASGGRMAYGN